MDSRTRKTESQAKRNSTTKTQVKRNFGGFFNGRFK